MRRFARVLLIALAACNSGSGNCPPTPGHCLPGYRANAQTCGCDPVPCKTTADCAGLGQVVCDTSQGICAASSAVDACAPVFTCQNNVKAGGTCDCHLDCQCLSGTSCVGAGGTCMPRCTDQSDPASFCDCAAIGTKCAPNGSCSSPCTIQSDCTDTQATCTGGFCIVPLNPSINTAPCDGGVD